VEFLLEKALLESEVLPEESYHNHRKSQWNRGSRTDKGVHALCNTIGVKLEVNIKYVDDYDPSQNREENKQRVNYGRLVNSVNAHLDTSII
jgi:tRNA pseudouridine38-40 synthase